MKTGRKLTALLLAMLMITGLLAMAPWTVKASASETTNVRLEKTYINPLFAELISEDDLVQPGSTTLYASGDEVEFLTDLDEVAAVIREGMKDREETIVVYYHMEDYTKDAAEELMEEIADAALVHTGVPTEGDYLMWQYGGWNSSASGSLYDDNSIDLTITYTYTYYTTAAEEAKVDTAVTNLLKELDVSKEDDYFKIKAIYDYICENVEYDNEHVNDTDYKTQFTAYGALIDGTSVCQGYAVLMYRLALELDVDCRLIPGLGKGEAHGWNIVELEDLYYNVDATWDAGYQVYSYFLLCDDNFKNHSRDGAYDTKDFYAAYPMGEEDYVYCSHVYDEGQVTKEPTCSEKGVTTYTCTLCGATYTEDIDMVEHTYDDGKVTKEPTCAEKGVTTYTCTVCGATYTEDIDMVEHTYDDGKVTTDPTCTETGIKTFTCTVCGGTRTEEVAATGHTWTSTVTEPTCSSEGYTEHICTICGYKYTDNYTDALNHQFTTVTVAATCSSEGYTQHTCTVCGYKYSDLYVDPLPHNFVDGVCTECGARAVYRVYGQTRYETSFAIADALKEDLCVTQFSTVIVASGTNFADALAGSYLASIKKAPILLASGSNDADVKDYINKNLASGGTVYLLGGTNALPESLEKELTGFNIKRLWGETRYETNLAILEEAGVQNQEILICTGTDFADSLSASAVGEPILLVGSSLSDAQKDFLKSSSGKFVIIGGENAVSSSIGTALQTYGTVERIGGETRYETSILVAKYFFNKPESAVLAYAYNFPDGLCGGPLAYAAGAPLILTATGSEEAAVEYTTKYEITQGYILGGSGLISDDTARAIFGMEDDARVTVW